MAWYPLIVELFWFTLPKGLVHINKYANKKINLLFPFFTRKKTKTCFSLEWPEEDTSENSCWRCTWKTIEIQWNFPRVLLDKIIWTLIWRVFCFWLLKNRTEISLESETFWYRIAPYIFCVVVYRLGSLHVMSWHAALINNM